MATPALEPAVTVYRGGIVENTHRAHVAVVDADGRLLYTWGDPHRMTLVRWAAKPAQALAVVETGALERFGFDDADLALMCGSNNSEDRHIERTRRMLAKVAAQESDMRCGPHPPLSDAVYRNWIKRDFTPGPACSNCSGKHVGMLAGARAIDAPIDDYHLPGHPLQARVRQAVAEVCGLPDDGVQWAIDGCNLPTPAFPLDRLARLYAKLADAADHSARAKAEGCSETSARTAALARIYHAMTAHPEMVAGEGRFCTALMEAFDGALVGKVGAEGSYAIGVRASAQTAPHVGARALGLAIKMDDGNQTALYAVVMEVLAQLGILGLLDKGTPERHAALARFHAPRISNTKGVETGQVTAKLALQATGAR